MQFYAGTLEIENNPHELRIWEKCKSFIESDEGIMAYKLPSLGFVEKESIPSFILRSETFGIVTLNKSLRNQISMKRLVQL